MRVTLPPGDVVVELGLGSGGRHSDCFDVVRGSIYWGLVGAFEDPVWQESLPSTAEGLLVLLQRVRAVLKCIQSGPCPICAARDPPQHRLRLALDSGCAQCAITAFLTA